MNVCIHMQTGSSGDTAVKNPALVLESAISPRSPVSNKNWRIVLETKIWVLSVLIAGSW